MSVKIIAQLHPLRSSRIKIMSSSKSIEEILNDLNSGFPNSQARVCRNGEIIKDFTLTANDGDTLWIKFVPYGTNEEAGVGMKIGGWAMMIAGVAVGIATSWTGIGLFAGTALFGTGLGMTLGGTVLLNMNIPSLKDKEKPDADPSIRGAKNQARPHGRIPVLFGRHRIYPDLAANSYTEISGNQQYLVQLFCGGYKDYEIDFDSFKLGETSLIKFSKTKNINAILSGTDPVIDMEILQNGETSRIYPHPVHEDVINAPLQNQIEDGDGNKISGEIERTTPDNTDKFNIDLFLHNGIGEYDKDGKLKTRTVEVWVSYKNIKDEKYTFLTAFEISGNELKTKRYQTTKSGLTPGQYTIKIERRSEDSNDSKIIDQVHIGSIRSYKTTDKDGNPVRPIRAERQKDLTIIALRVMATDKLNNVLDSFNYVATSTIPVHTREGCGPLYWLNAAKTQNPAAMLIYALRGRASQQHVDDNDIDWASIEEFYAWCDQKDEDGDYKYACNAYLSESVTIAQLIKMIGNTSRADILRIDSKISVVQDIERPAPVQLFTPKNSIGYSITMFQADVPDSISLRYIDEKSGFAQSELSVYNTPNGNRNDDLDTIQTIQKADLWGITDSKQARRIGMYNYACLKNRPFVHSIEVDLEYLLCNKGDWIQYAGDIALTGSVQGRIKGIIYADGICVGIDTDEPVVPTDGQQHAVRIRLSNGTIILKDVVFYPGILREKALTYYPVDDKSEDISEPSLGDMYVIDEAGNYYYEPQNVIFFIEPITDNNIPKAGDIYAFGVHGYEVIDLVITDIQPQADLNATLTCVEYSPEIFKVDEPDFILPDFVNKITPVSGAVDSGLVNTNNWRNFFVFHDSEEEPPRPAGDGQNDGWYRLQNFRSLWQSTKIAETIDTGEWGPPQRINARRGTDDITPVWLSLAPQNITLETDGNGNVLAGLLPATSQARLHQWNAVLEGAVYSLQGAPAGVSVNSNGLITIAVNNALTDNNQITVRAEYKGEAYTTVLFIKKSLKNIAPKYLGATYNPGTSNGNVIINERSVQAYEGDWVMYIGTATTWTQNRIYKWTNGGWIRINPPTEIDRQNAAMYLVATADVTDGMPEAVFSFAQIRSLVASSIFTKLLAAGEIELNNEYGLGGIIRSANYKTSGGTLGWMIDFLGNAVFNNIKARGRIDATEGSIKNLKIGGSTTFLATEIKVDSLVSAGTNYIIRENNIPAEKLLSPGTSGVGPIKELTTAANGTVTLRIKIDAYGYGGEIIIKVNNTERIRFPFADETTTIHESNINLTENISTLSIYARSRVSNPSITISIFQIMCRDDPGLLRLLG